MTKQELTIKLNELLERYEQRTDELVERQRRGELGLSAQLAIYVGICNELEALVLEAVAVQPC